MSQSGFVTQENNGLSDCDCGLSGTEGEMPVIDRAGPTPCGPTGCPAGSSCQNGQCIDNASGEPINEPIMHIQEDKASQTEEDAVEEAKKYSNPEIPLWVKITGGAALALALAKIGG